MTTRGHAGGRKSPHALYYVADARQGAGFPDDLNGAAEAPAATPPVLESHDLACRLGELLIERDRIDMARVGLEGLHRAEDLAVARVDGFDTLVWVPVDGTWKIAFAGWARGGQAADKEDWNDVFRVSNSFKKAPNQLQSA